MASDNCDLTWTNLFMSLVGLNELSNKKFDKTSEKIINVTLKIIRLLVVLFYAHLTAQMFAISVMGIYVKHNRLPILIWYYYAIIQGISAIIWFLSYRHRGHNSAQLRLMSRVMTLKRRKVISFLDLFLSGSTFIFFTLSAIIFPLFNAFTKNIDSLRKWYSSKSAESSAAYVHNFIIPCSEVSCLTMLIGSHLYVCMFHCHLDHVAQSLREKITGLNGENKERLIKRFFEWVQRREEAMRRFSFQAFGWTITLIVNFLVKNVDGFDKTTRPDLYPLKLLLLVLLFILYGYFSGSNYKSFKETHAAAIKYLNLRGNNNNNKVQLNRNVEMENELLEQLTHNVVIEPPYILSIFKCKLFRIDNNLPFKLFLSFLILYLTPSMLFNK